MTEKGNFDFYFKPIKEKMQELISHINFITYIDKLVPIDIDGKFIVLETQSESFASYITNTLASKMRDAIVKANVDLLDFRLKVEGKDEYAYNPPDDMSNSSATSLEPRFTFDSFVVGKSNEFVHAASLEVANNPAGNYNPLFIYGDTGLGKTHLVQAIGNHILANKPNLKVIYVTCDRFYSAIIDSMVGHGDSRNKANKLRLYYRTADVLIIDDIQFIANKFAVQQEFFHIFNELVSKGKQIIITSDQHPKYISELEDRLKTRFSGGLIFDINPPDFELKIAILKRKAFEKKCIVPDEVLFFLAQGSSNDVRSLEGRLKKVIWCSKLHETPITMALAKTAFNEAVSDEQTEEGVKPENVITAVTNYFHLAKNDIVGKSKKKEIVIPRQICCYLMCELMNLPLISIGKALGDRDHTTILYSRDKVAELCRVNDKIAKDVDDIKNIILKK